jgi:hypothetical protein
MTNFEMEKSVTILLALLDERRLRSEVDEPLEQAAAAFRWAEVRERSYWSFQELVIAFRQHLDQHAFGRSLKIEDAYAEAIGFLDQIYPRRAGKGHEAALWDFCQSCSGSVERIGGCVIQGLRSQERAARIRHALVMHLPHTWKAQCEFTRFVLEHFELAESIRSLSTSRLAESLENLLLGFAQAESHLRQLVGSENVPI